MSQTIKCNAACPGVLIEEGLKVQPSTAKACFQSFVGKTIKQVVLQKDEESNQPMIRLHFEQGGAAWILADAEGNGPGWIEFTQ